MESINEQVYTVFNGEGKLLQIEYGLEAVYSSPQIVSIATGSSIVCVSKKMPMPVLCADKYTTVFRIGDGLYMHITGTPADVDYVVAASRKLASSLEFSLGTRVTPDVFTRCLADKMQNYMQRSGTRVPAFAAGICGFEKGEPLLYYTDISAVEYAVHCCVAGEDHGKMQKYLEKHYKPCEGTEAVELGISALLESIGRHAEYTEVDVVVVTADGLKPLGDQEIDRALQNIAERQ